MVEKQKKLLTEYRQQEREENLRLLMLRTEAEGVGSIKYGDDTSHGTRRADKMELATIKLSEERKKIADKRRPRFDMIAETYGWFFERLEPREALVMVFYSNGMTYRDIADRCGRSVGWVSETIKRSKKALVNKKSV